AQVNQAKMKGDVVNKAGLALGFQRSAVEVLTAKSMRAVREFGAGQLLLCGGVAANRGLRDALEKACVEADVPLVVPPLQLCTDNAAMIGAAAFLKWERGEFAELDLKAEAMLPLERWIGAEDPANDPKL